MFAETDEQELLAASTGRFLDAHFPIERVRALARQESTFEAARWREAAQLGWTAFLVPEGDGGGSVSGNGLADLLVVAFEFGRHVAPGPLFGTNAVAAALGRWGSAAQRSGPLAALVSGAATAAWAHERATGLPGAPGRRAGGVTATGTGDGVVLAGRAGAVEGVADAGYLLVTAAEAMGSTQYLVPVAAPGVELVPLRSIDLTRRFHDVVLADVVVAPDARVGPPGAGSEQDAHLRDLVTTLALGEIVGALDRAFAMTVEWTANRYSFGRPLASYQEIKHRMADLRTVLEAGAAVASRAAAALGTGAPDGRSWAAAGLAYLGRSGPEAIQDCIQLHGGIGVTADHDLHLYLRRATLDAHCFGGPADAARRLGGLVAEAEGLLAATGGGR